MKSLGGMVQWSLGLDRVMAGTGRVEAPSSAMVALTVRLVGVVQIFALKMDQLLMVVTA
jgi:hypothetical protein